MTRNVPENVVSVRGVSTSYPGVPVLNGVDFTVAAGEFVSLIGPSGSGKSTLLAVIAGLMTADSGDVVAPPCAYMPQKDLLFPWRSVLENTILGLDVRGVPKNDARARARALFPAFGLSGFEDARPAELSGGMRQRAALLRTVIQDRDVLLLDEPLGALDSLTRSSMQDWLQDVRQQYGWTIVMITHDIREAVYLSDRVVVLSPRPAGVIADLTVELPRPRDLTVTTTPEFAAYERRLLELLRA